MGHSDALTAFAGPQQTPQTGEALAHRHPFVSHRHDPDYRYEHDPGHRLENAGQGQIWKRFPTKGLGACYQGVCGIFRDEVFVPVPIAFPDIFNKKK